MTIKDNSAILSNFVALELYLIDIVRFTVAAAAGAVLSRIYPGSLPDQPPQMSAHPPSPTTIQ